MFTTFILAIFLLTFSVNIHAESNSLPFIVANDNIDGFHDFIYSLPQASNSNLVFLNAYESGEYFGYDYYENGTHKYAFYVPQDEFIYSFYLSNSYSDFDITTDYAEMTFSNFIFVSGYTVPAPRGGYYFYGSRQTNTVTSSLTVRFFYGSSKGDGSLLVPNIASQNYNYELNIYQPVFGFGTPDIPYVGHATAPGDFDSPVYDSGHTKPDHVPTIPNINNYSWTTYNNPSIDTTNLESLVQSLIDIVIYNFNYLFSNLSGLFSNLIANIGSFIFYLGQLLEYYGNLIISNIQNAITTFYNNMVSLFDPIFDVLSNVGVVVLSLIALGTDPETGLFSIPYLTQVLLVPDAVNVVELIVANDEFDLIESGKVVVTSFPLIVNQLTSVSPSPVFHVPSCYYHGQQIGDFDISFSWFNNYKVYYDILINGFLIIGYIYWLFVSFSSHLRGVYLPETPDDSYKRHNIGF